MNKKTTNAKDFDIETKEKFNLFKDQLLIVLIKRLGGIIDISIDESNDTGNDILLMESDPVKGFHFEVKKKTKTEKTAIAIESWKLPMFKKELEKSGFEYKKKAGLTSNTLTLMVKTNDLYQLGEAVKRANDKAAKTKMN